MNAHRAGRALGAGVVLAAASVALLVAATASSGAGAWNPPKLENTWDGAWSTEWGVLKFDQTGSKLQGTYTHDEGRISGSLNGARFTIVPAGGNVFTGTWNEAPTRTGPSDAGPVEFRAGRTARTFTGRWAYAGSATSWHTNWNGTCTAGKCLLNAVLVPIGSVSNGCGGAGWASVVKVQNYLGNSSTYVDSNVNPAAKSYRVSFVDACNIHDAGYSGAIVKDPISGAILDFRGWSRKQVDDKFLEDMRLLCTKSIPASASVALAKCRGRGGALSFGAVSRYDFVRKWGDAFFDANLARPGTQESGHRANS